MYSSLYYNFFIRSDYDYSGRKSLKEVKDFLNGLKELHEKDQVSYTNSESFPWIDIELVLADRNKNWFSNKSIQEVNLLVIVGSKIITDHSESSELRYQLYLNLMRKIANFLGWEIINEELEEGIEEFVVYRP